MKQKSIIFLIIIIVIIVFIIIAKLVSKNTKNSEIGKENTIKNLYSNNYVEIAKIISHNDEKVTKEIGELIADPTLYFNNHKSEYEERWINDSNDIDTIIWIGIVDCLIRNDYACELDYAVELDDFVYFMNNMNYDIKFDKEALNENGNVAQWCSELDKKLQIKNLCIGGIDINSDSYVMFICEKSELKQLYELSKNLNHKITYASKM